MKSFYLNELCEVLGINNKIGVPIKINKVMTKITGIDSNTVVFHLRKTQSLNIKKLNKLKNCFIVTDQPLLTDYKHLQDKFLFVSDIEKAYFQLVDYYRNQLKIKTIGVTGTCGKTTTKEMILQVLEKKYQITGTVSSKNNLGFNHDYLMDMDDSKDFGVYEMALTDPGNIIYSGHFFKPSIGIITNIGIDHLSGCKTFENYVLAKGEMLTALENKGTLVINNDDENIKRLDLSNFKGKILTTGIKNKASYYASKISYGTKKTYFILNHQDKEYEVMLPIYGEHNVYNALQALAVLHTVGMSLDEAIEHLATYQPIKAHFEFYEGLNGSTVIDDTFSSNPTSIEAALKTLIIKNKVKIAVLGNISYLGKYEKFLCDDIGKMVVKYHIDYLVTIDEFSERIGRAALKYGMDEAKIYYTKTNDELRNVLKNLLKPNVMVLFKTSMFDYKTKKTLRFFIKDKQE